ncbi:MAG: VOC family protein, partial [Acidobacteria bacterium]|nr:VOC family protein [Acidobacteriota bacterium]
MKNKAKPIPEGFHTLTPHIVVKGASEAIEFYKKAFGAREVGRMPGP